MHLTILFFGVSLVFIILTFKVVKNNYSKFPDKIPVHFGFSGKADNWANKSPVFAYLLPILGSFQWILFLVLSIPIFSSENPEVQVWYTPLITLGLTFTLYYLQLGIVRYILEEEKNIRKYLFVGIGILIATVFLPLIFD